jgi:hypothetical protein
MLWKMKIKIKPSGVELGIELGIEISEIGWICISQILKLFTFKYPMIGTTETFSTISVHMPVCVKNGIKRK